MKTDPKISNNRVIYEYRNFSAVGVLGECNVPLSEWSSPQFSLPELEYSPVKNGDNFKVLAMFLYQPRSHLDLVAYSAKAGSYSIFSTGLDLNLAKANVDLITNKLNFQVKTPNEKFINEFETDFNLQVNGVYSIASEFSGIVGISPERIVGSAKYANFLYLYHGLTSIEALKKSNKRFSLSEIFDEPKSNRSKWN